MTEKQFIEVYCHKCGTQRCEGIGTEWFEGCPKRWNLDGYGDAAAEIEKLNEKIMELGHKLVRLSESKHGKWLDTDTFDFHCVHIYQCSNYYKEVADDYISRHKYCLHCGALMDES